MVYYIETQYTKCVSMRIFYICRYCTLIDKCQGGALCNFHLLSPAPCFPPSACCNLLACRLQFPVVGLEQYKQTCMLDGISSNFPYLLMPILNSLFAGRAKRARERKEEGGRQRKRQRERGCSYSTKCCQMN